MKYDFSFPPYIIANLVALFILIAAIKWPTTARILLGLIFTSAFAINLFTAMYDPSAYLEFGEMTSSDSYRNIILGPFSHHTDLYILAIAICQLYIGIFTTYQGRLMKIAMTGGMVFLFAISPLGFGAAFPATALIGFAFLVLLFRKNDLNIYDAIRLRATLRH